MFLSWFIIAGMENEPLQYRYRCRLILEEHERKESRPRFYNVQMSTVNLWGRQRRGFCGKFAEILRKFCGKFADTTSYCARKGCGNSAESLRKFRRNSRKIFCNDPFPNDPISELLKMDAAVLGDRLPEGTQKPLLGPSSLPLQCWH